jgi:hypothetical protein
LHRPAADRTRLRIERDREERCSLCVDEVSGRQVPGRRAPFHDDRSVVPADRLHDDLRRVEATELSRVSGHSSEQHGLAAGQQLWAVEALTLAPRDEYLGRAAACRNPDDPVGAREQNRVRCRPAQS